MSYRTPIQEAVRIATSQLDAVLNTRAPLAGRKMPLWFGSAGPAFDLVMSEYARMWGGFTHERKWAVSTFQNDKG